MVMKVKDMRTESPQELRSKLDNLRKKYMELRFQHSAGTLKNPLELRTLRKDIARILTIVGEKKAETVK
jgi:large subunit ribosomal protein L29